MPCGQRNARLVAEMPTLKGIMLAIANVLVIATGMSVVTSDGEMFMPVVVFASIPAAVLGALLGLLAGMFATRSRHWRAPRSHTAASSHHPERRLQLTTCACN